MDKSVNTDLIQRELQEVVEKLTVLENKVVTVKEEHDHMPFRLANILYDEKMVTFYTGFPSFTTLRHALSILDQLLIIYPTKKMKVMLVEVDDHIFCHQ